MKSHDIRQSFIDFFAERDHRPVPSAPLVPHGDATLLFTNAGMVQFKDVFLGHEKAPHPRAVTAQKCLRVSGKHNDLENVGPSPRHHTFFEMLGNFSFGDYFKETAIEHAWELVTGRWGLEPGRLFATVFREDDEAHDLWLRISGLPAERVIRCGEKDNFWAMGDTGPCGPCSEIFVDCRPDEPAVDFEEGSESGRYLEIWNLVFMQFDRDGSGEQRPLPKPSIDTGSGLERVAAVLQGVDSNYDTDLFQPILRAAAERAGTSYGEDAGNDVSLRVIADHLRASGFLLADGVIPANDGRGYVLRRILRRAVRHGMRLGLQEPFLGDLLPVLGRVMGDSYPELGAAEDGSRATLRAEEDKFLDTVAVGSSKVQTAIEEARERGLDAIPGASAFRLYDTYGLPEETIREIAEEEQFAIDEAGFREALEEQRRRSRVATAGRQSEMKGARTALLGDGELVATEFEGYDRLDLEGAEVLRIARLTDDGAVAVEELGAGDEGVVAFDRTVFYAESGGQVADTGALVAGDAARGEVIDVQREGTAILHRLRWLGPEPLRIGQQVRQVVTETTRRATERHHTATHLLHAALREELGEGVRQAGSLVHPERLRFDFTYGGPVEEERLRRIEDRVSEWVRRAAPVETRWQGYDEAVAEGAMALFGEKYGDRVRTVEVPGFSLELCGGCHVRNTGEIGGFVVTGERGVASGVRRVEALAGAAADAWLRGRSERLAELESALGAEGERAAEELAALQEKLRRSERELSELRMQVMAGGPAAGTDAEEAEVGGVRVLTREVPSAPMNELRNLADVLRSRLGSGVVVLAARSDGKVSFIATVTEDLGERLHAGRLARALGDAVGGSGGGRPDFAQAGGTAPESLEAAFEAAREAVAEQLGVAQGVAP